MPVKNKLATLFAIPFGVVISCSTPKENNPKIKEEEGLIMLKTEIYDTLGNTIFSIPRKVWFRDSCVIEEIASITERRDPGKEPITIVTPLWYRFIHLHRGKYYDYKTLTDTADIFGQGPLPDTVFSDQGWTFYTEKNFEYKGVPEPLSDTIINAINYKRVKFPGINRAPEGSYRIGYYRCDNKGAIFSFEKKYSRQINCTMTYFVEYRPKFTKGFASQKIEFVSDTLSKKEADVLEAWKSNVKE